MKEILLKGHYGGSGDEAWKYDALYIREKDGTQNFMINPGAGYEDMAHIYITLKVIKDEKTGKVKLDQSIKDLTEDAEGDIKEYAGKKNIVEINGYTSYDSNKKHIAAVDLNSNPGSLKPRDINTDTGKVIIDSNVVDNRNENDTYQAGNVKLVIDKDEGPIVISGYTFEDLRQWAIGKAVIGNGSDINADGMSEDQRINGVTVELIELVREVNSDGSPMDKSKNYIGEKKWDSYTLSWNGSNGWDTNTDSTRYSTGDGNARIVLQGTGYLGINIDNYKMEKDKGEYKFVSLPPGDFFIRFTYGDTTETVLVNKGTNEVNSLISGNSISEDDIANGILGSNGRNGTSYNGQDYKSTIYQRFIEQNKISDYGGVSSYKDADKQNYNGYSDKGAMYYYDIKESDKRSDISDAKDVYSYRADEIKYSRGSEANEGNGEYTLKNHRAEVLASPMQLTTEAKNAQEYGNTNKAIESQKAALKELMEETKMVAQTGVIDVEIEYTTNNSQVEGTGRDEEFEYTEIEHVNLGLTERPEAQLQLSKELTNIQIKLANGQVLFDTQASVPNLTFGSHYIDETGKYNPFETSNSDKHRIYSRYKRDDADFTGYKLREVVKTNQEKRAEELALIYMDEEIIGGATVTLKYKLSVDNIGDVDYLDKQFYYTGEPESFDESNISKTQANKVLDYVTNEMDYEAKNQDFPENWDIITTNDLIYDNNDKDLVNATYKDTLNTYNILIKTENLSGDLLPRTMVIGEANPDYSKMRKEVTLTLTTVLTNTMRNNNFVYANLAEIIETQNDAGRKMQYSVVGNQQMADQSLKDDAEHGYSSLDYIKPSEVDADSAQKVTILPPTGENKNYNRIIVIGIISLVIIGLAAFVIKKKVLISKN